jgi:hypothetical protein
MFSRCAQNLADDRPRLRIDSASAARIANPGVPKSRFPSMLTREPVNARISQVLSRKFASVPRNAFESLVSRHRPTPVPVPGLSNLSLTRVGQVGAMHTARPLRTPLPPHGFPSPILCLAGREAISKAGTVRRQAVRTLRTEKVRFPKSRDSHHAPVPHLHNFPATGLDRPARRRSCLKGRERMTGRGVDRRWPYQGSFCAGPSERDWSLRRRQFRPARISNGCQRLRPQCTMPDLASAPSGPAVQIMRAALQQGRNRCSEIVACSTAQRTDDEGSLIVAPGFSGI